MCTRHPKKSTCLRRVQGRPRRTFSATILSSCTLLEVPATSRSTCRGLGLCVRVAREQQGRGQAGRDQGGVVGRVGPARRFVRGAGGPWLRVLSAAGRAQCRRALRSTHISARFWHRLPTQRASFQKRPMLQVAGGALQPDFRTYTTQGNVLVQCTTRCGGCCSCSSHLRHRHAQQPLHLHLLLRCDAPSSGPRGRGWCRPRRATTGSRGWGRGAQLAGSCRGR